MEDRKVGDDLRKDVRELFGVVSALQVILEDKGVLKAHDVQRLAMQVVSRMDRKESGDDVL